MPAENRPETDLLLLRQETGISCSKVWPLERELKPACCNWTIVRVRTLGHASRKLRDIWCESHGNVASATRIFPNQTGENTPH